VRVEPKNLVRRLTPTATKVLEAAVSRASEGRYYEIVVEHLLLSMLEADDGDAAAILKRFGADRGRLAVRVEKILERMKTGNPGRPVFSENVFKWIEDAWVVASVEFGATRLRTGLLLAQLIAQPSKYTPESLTELEVIPPDELKRVLEDVVGRGNESLEVGPEPGSGGAGAAGGGAAGRAGAGGEALRRYTTDFTEKARKGEIDPIFGRHREIRQMIDILLRRRKNNPIIVGEPGVGKTALVEGLALAIARGEVPEALKNVDLRGLDLGLLQAGAGVKGEFENRLKGVITETKASPKPVILFIDEAHTLIGAGGAAGGSDAANLLKPALARGELRTIAATTFSEFKKYFEKDAALERRFQPVKVDEPSEEDAIVMMRGLRATYEEAHGVPIRDEAVVAAVKLSHRYLSGRQLPDKAVDLLDTAAARVRMEQDAPPEAVVTLENDLAALDRQRDAWKRDRDAGHAVDEADAAALDKRLAHVRDELGALRARWEVERARAADLRKARKAAMQAADGKGEAAAPSDPESLKKAIAAAAEALQQIRGEEPLIHPDVDVDVVARVVAGWTGVPVGKMRSDALAAALNLEEKLTERVRGQPAALKTVSEVVRMAYAGIRNPGTPVGVLLFVGPSGVGKTETALALADLLYGGERFVTTINMSEFQEKHTVSRLIGSPPGYVGFGEGGVLTEAVRHRPYSVVLLDECEKADLEVMNLFYQVFDKGMLSDGEGRLIDFRNTLIILTSNLATDQIMKLYERDEPPKTEEVATTIRPVLSKHFKPALLARMTIVPFAPVGLDVMRGIAEMKLAALAGRLRASHRVETTFEPELVKELVRRCTENEAGARNVEHALRSSLMPAIAREILQRMTGGPLPRQLTVGLSPEGDWRVEFAA
jgi:type VI secretion system protein VasG